MWKNQPLATWIEVDRRRKEEVGAKPILTTSTRFQICKMALYVLEISERKLFERFDEWERAQMLATWQTENEITWVQTAFPKAQRKRK